MPTVSFMTCLRFLGGAIRSAPLLSSSGGWIISLHSMACLRDCERCWREGGSQRLVSIAGRRRCRRGSVPPALVQETAHCHACCSAYPGRARPGHPISRESHWVSSRSPVGRGQESIELGRPLPLRQEPRCRRKDWLMRAPRRPREPKQPRNNYSRVHSEDGPQCLNSRLYFLYFEVGRSMVTRLLATTESVECRWPAW